MAITWAVGPWVWRSMPVPAWNPPAGFIGVDLRGLDKQTIQDGTPGLGLFVGDGTLSSDYKVIGTGADWSTIQLSPSAKDAIPKRTGYNFSAVNLRGIIIELLTTGADPDGGECHLPIMPMTGGRLGVDIGRSARIGFRWGNAYSDIVKRNLRIEFRKLMQDALSGKLIDTLHHRRVLDYWCCKYGIRDAWREFVPDDLQADVPGPIDHATTYTEAFTRADSTSVMGNDLTWTQVAGTFGTYSNTGFLNTDSVTYNLARAEHDLSSADHYSQLQLATPSGALTPGNTDFNGPAARHASAAQTCYMTSIFTTDQYITKVVAGTGTNLANAASTFGTTITYKIECNGSTIKGYNDGVEVVSVTDSSITGNTRCGISASLALTCWDNFECADLAAGSVGPTAFSVSRLRNRTLRIM